MKNELKSRYVRNPIASAESFENLARRATAPLEAAELLELAARNRSIGHDSVKANADHFQASIAFEEEANGHLDMLQWAAAGFDFAQAANSSRMGKRIDRAAALSSKAVSAFKTAAENTMSDAKKALYYICAAEECRIGKTSTDTVRGLVKLAVDASDMAHENSKQSEPGDELRLHQADILIHRSGVLRVKNARIWNE